MIDKQIKELRNYFGLTQAEFGRRIGRTLSTVQNWERGSNPPPKSALRSICEAFDVKEHWLHTGKGEMFRDTRKQIGNLDSDSDGMTTVMQEDINELISLLRDYGSPRIVKQFIRKMNEIKKAHEEE